VRATGVRGSRAFGEENSLPSLDFLFFLCLPAPLGSSLSVSLAHLCCLSSPARSRSGAQDLLVFWWSDQLDTEFYDSGEHYFGKRKGFGGFELQVLLF
jgi:hypothetical protein